MKGHRQRLRERFIKDLGNSMHEYEVLELLLMHAIVRKDVKPIAKALLKQFGTISGVLGADILDLQKVEGIGNNTAIFIKTIHTTSALAAKAKMVNRNILSCYENMIDYCMITMAHKKIEQFRVIFLDNKNRIIADEEQTRGTINQTNIYPREIIKRALELSASNIILVHNHPSGDPTASNADIEMTLEVMEAGNAMQIRLYDHIVIGKEGYMSLKNQGHI